MKLRSTLTAQAIDDVLEGTFPASDPPAWTPGMARPAPVTAQPRRGAAPDDTNRAGNGVVDVSRPARGGEAVAPALVSLAGAMGLTLVVPAVVLAVGIPVAIAVRGVLEAVERLVALVG